MLPPMSMRFLSVTQKALTTMLEPNLSFLMPCALTANQLVFRTESQLPEG